MSTDYRIVRTNPARNIEMQELAWAAWKRGVSMGPSEARPYLTYLNNGKDRIQVLRSQCGAYVTGFTRWGTYSAQMIYDLAKDLGADLIDEDQEERDMYKIQYAKGYSLDFKKGALRIQWEDIPDDDPKYQAEECYNNIREILEDNEELDQSSFRVVRFRE